MLSIRLLGRNRQERQEAIVRIIIRSLVMLTHWARNEQPKIKKHGKGRPQKVINNFGEPSTRTDNSFQEAVRALGWIICAGIRAESSSIGKGETEMNTLRMVSQYGITHMVMRKKTEGDGLHLAQCHERTCGAMSWVPKDVSILVAGAGTRDHISQIFLDIATIVLRALGVRTLDDLHKVDKWLRNKESLAKKIVEILNELKIAFVGDLLHSRVTHDWIHLGEIFTIKFLFIGPRPLWPEKWCVEGISSGFSEELSSAHGCDIIYTIRLQIERLKEMMSEHEARTMVLQYQITSDFMAKFRGELMDALPLDAHSPMIHPDVINHPRNIMFMQSYMGVPTRMAMLVECDEGRQGTFPLLRVPSFRMRSEFILKAQSHDEHMAEMKRKYRGREMFAGQVSEGVVIDRLRPGTVDTIHRLNDALGVYRGEHGPILLGKDFISASMGRKEVLFMHGVDLPPSIATIYGLVAPEVRISMMTSSHGYRRLELPLPEAVEGVFPCLNTDCVTNHCPEARTFHFVSGTKGAVGLNCAYCERPFSMDAILQALNKR